MGCNHTGNGGTALVQAGFPRGELVRGHRAQERAQRLAGSTVLGGETEPDISLDRIPGHFPALGVGEAEVVLGDGIAFLRLGAQGAHIGFGRTQGDREDKGYEHQRPGQGASEQTWFHRVNGSAG